MKKNLNLVLFAVLSSACNGTDNLVSQVQEAGIESSVSDTRSDEVNVQDTCGEQCVKDSTCIGLNCLTDVVSAADNGSESLTVDSSAEVVADTSGADISDVTDSTLPMSKCAAGSNGSLTTIELSNSSKYIYTLNSEGNVLYGSEPTDAGTKTINLQIFGVGNYILPASLAVISKDPITINFTGKTGAPVKVQTYQVNLNEMEQNGVLKGPRNSEIYVDNASVYVGCLEKHFSNNYCQLYNIKPVLDAGTPLYTTLTPSSSTTFPQTGEDHLFVFRLSCNPPL